ncbi:Sodium:sulfate symporter transmembrane region family protein [Histomonas meleagridis]|uniref:Sodium:sulfate symporter transmembrane region family protein n=1 Tax=Histomonas meleagridis TaxID=135588 RepID=UPI00355AAF41|nr:Sodium:sulfate symporter transmembrane region family protein [Histomonas meleagridis]KAH0796160.1 Sodium:sulfate symporter transmembrane region family protein [Histomonas meleagridis]
MKFGKQLRFVAVKAWFPHYIQYKQFKKMIKSFATRLNEAHEQNQSESDIQKLKDECYANFKEALINNINDCLQFFSSLVAEATERIEKLSTEIEHTIEDQEEESKDEETATSFHKQVFVAVLNLYEIRSFLSINKTGTFCIAKKFRKKMQDERAVEEFDTIREDAFDHQPTIDAQMSQLEELYIKVKREINPKGDKRPRQEIILELHKSIENSLLWKQSTVVNKWSAYTFRQNEFQMSAAPIKWSPIIVGFVLMMVFMFLPIMNSTPEARRCLAMLIFCAVLWVTTAVPLWLTSLSIPFITTVARLVPGQTIPNVAKLIQNSTMSSTVYLIIGGFTIAAAFKETEMDKRIAAMILKRSTSSVPLFVFSVIVLNAFFAMWINNVASTMIVVTLVTPTLQQLPQGSTFAKLVLLGIAAGGNFGGLTTPLSSPQNAIAIQAVENVNSQLQSQDPSYQPKSFGFVEYLATAFPPAVVGCIIYWAIIIFVYKSDVKEVPKFSDVKTDFGWRQIFVSIVSLASIVLWIVLPFGGEDVFGDNGIVGFLPFLLFYGTGVLPPSRLSELPWNILFLVMGGNALGTVVEQSQLLRIVSNLLRDLLGNTSLWVSLLIIDVFVLIINIFISHTVSATILLPLICDFSMNEPHFRLFAMQANMATTASQILPVSSFPNLCCVSLQDRNGKEYLKTADILKSGSIATVISFVCIISIQYGIGYAYGL